MDNRSLDPAVLTALKSLESDLTNFVNEHGQSAEFWRVFSERASLIEDLAGSDGWLYVNSQLDWMLERAGIDPGGWSSAFDA